MTWEEEQEKTAKILDVLDLPKPKPWTEIRAYRRAVEDKFKNVELPEEFEGELFNFMDDYSFGLYIKKRFNAQIEEESRYFIVY